MEIFKQTQYACYGVSVRNRNCDAHETVAYQELKSLNSSGTIHIDIARSDDSTRPELEKLIEKMGLGDVITLYSIDTLLTGNRNKGVEYYKRILDKKISIEIYDFSGRIPKLSKFSRFFYEEAIKIFGERDCDELVAELEEYAREVQLESKKRSMKKFDVSYILEFDNAFKNIYFAYEAYQLDLKTTLELLRDYCNIKSEITFRSMAMAYECSVEYETDFDSFSSKHKDLLYLPKRTGSIPEEFYYIKDKIEEKRNDPDADLQNAPESYLFELVVDPYMYITYNVYHRWDLLYQKKPKPRKPIGDTFKVDEFKKKFKPINE